MRFVCMTPLVLLFKAVKLQVSKLECLLTNRNGLFKVDVFEFVVELLFEFL